MKLLQSLAGVIILLVLVALSLIDGAPLGISTKWVPFFGRFHPVLLHLPIGLFAGVVLLEVYLFVNPDKRVPEKIKFLLDAAYFATVLTALFGIFLSWEGGYDGDSLNFHKWAGIITAGLILGLGWLVKRRDSQPEKLPTAYLGGLVATIAAITITGHKGGSLTHGSNFLTEYNPFGTEVEVAEVTADTSVFVSRIQPLLKDYCFQCHSSEKIKGELRLDTFEMMMVGGVNGPVLEAGDSEASTLMHVLGLPIEEDEHMPPKGKPQPSEEIQNLLAWWIDQGASETAKLEEFELTTEVALHFLEVEVLEFQTREEIEVQMESLEEREAISVYYLAQDDFRLGARGNKATDADLEILGPLKSNIIELNLAKSDISDAGLETIGLMTNLTHLHINNTPITNAGLEYLTNLYQLEYLNLYGTAITDDGLLPLRRLKALKKVFLWETAVSEEAVASLHNSVFASVESENLRLQIEELSKRRDRLEVDIVSAFDISLQVIEEVVVVSEPEISISDIMINFHKGEESVATQARDGTAEKEDLQRMLEHYQALLDLTPPKGTLESWKIKTTKLIESAVGLVESDPGAIEAYKTAVNCKACHTEHRTD